VSGIIPILNNEKSIYIAIISLIILSLFVTSNYILYKCFNFEKKEPSRIRNQKVTIILMETIWKVRG
jgi:flagellar basal body-associated protein FliL